VIEVVCGVILDEDGKVLACRRSLDRHLGGLWEFPGGKVEAGEAPESALARELLEELGIVVDVGERLDAVVEWSDGAVTIRLTGFRCVIRSGEAQALEHDEIRWCGLGELSGLDWAEADVPLVEEIQNSKF
jgi:8-oxo-dGTP diphosphatase